MARSFMVIAGEASGDALASELVTALRERTPADTTFFGVGGQKMAAAGVDMIFDFARNAVWGLEAFTRIFEFKRRFQELLKVAVARRPDAIICVDFSGFNRRFARAVKQEMRRDTSWKPRIIQYVSPQVWASRARRADHMADDIDLLLTIFPFEKAWYARRAPDVRVEFVGHPVVDRFASALPKETRPIAEPPHLVLLPGSRPSELKRHLPILREAMRLIRKQRAVRVTMVMPEHLVERAREIGLPEEVELRSKDLAGALATADAAIAKSGTITLECGFFGVPTVTMYQTSWLTYNVAKRIVTVKWVSMPNILADEELFPEFIQNAATPEDIARAALEFLSDSTRRTYVKTKLKEIVSSLGERGASGRAAAAILRLMDESLQTVTHLQRVASETQK